jgi:hypothetical protein
LVVALAAVAAMEQQLDKDIEAFVSTGKELGVI